MKRLLLHLFILILFLISCKSQKIDYDFNKIELTAYYWNYDKNPYGNHMLTGKIFSVIDSLGECKVIDYDEGIFKFTIVQIPDSLIKKLLDKLSLLKSDLDLRPSPNKPILYDGPILRISYYSENGRKNIDFIDTENHSEKIYLELYHYIENLNQNTEFVDTAVVWELRMKQLENIYDKFYQTIYRRDTTVMIDKVRLIK